VLLDELVLLEVLYCSELLDELDDCELDELETLWPPELLELGVELLELELNPKLELLDEVLEELVLLDELELLN